MRLGLALHRSRGEVRALPAPEYRDWQLFYILEPWGFQDQEYRTAALMSTIYNMLRGKNKAKSPDDFMRDMLKGALAQLQPPPDLENMTDAEKENVRRAVKSFFGIG